MELAKIEILLEKYMDATTTLQEEKLLKDYFSTHDVPAHLEEYKDMFVFFDTSRLESSERSISLPKKSFDFRWLSVAAMIVFFVGIFALYQQNEAEKREAQLAYAETQKALEMISKSLNKGTSAVAQLENFNKGTKAMAQLQTFEQTQNRIFNP